MSDNYIFHPLGDFAKNYTNGTIKVSDPRYPKSHLNYPNGGIDFNPGANLPVYAMVSGVILFIGAFNEEADYNNNMAGYCLEIASDNFGYSGTVYTRYFGLGRLSEKLAQKVNLKGGDSGDRIQEASSFKNKVSIPVNKGDILGYTNDIGGGHSQLHIDLQQKPTLSDATYLPSKDFPFDKNDSKIKKYGTGYSEKNGNWYQEGELVGILGADGIGKVPGADFNVFNHYWYCMILSRPQYKENLVEGGIPPSPTCDVWSVDYLNLTFSASYMGKCPETIDEINSDACRPIKTIALACKGEFGLNEQGISYSKLMRAWIMHHPVYFPKCGNFRDPSATLDTFAKYWSSLVYDKWGGWRYMNVPYYDAIAPQTKEMLSFIQNVYNNIASPNIFGITTKYILEICSNMPFSNQTVSLGSKVPVLYDSVVQFLTQEPYSGGWYVMFRTTGMDQEMKATNPAVIGG